MFCLLLLSLLMLAHAKDNAVQEVDGDLAVSVNNSTAENESLNSAGQDIFDMVVMDATGEFDRAASISQEELRLSREQFLGNPYLPPGTDVLAYPYPSM